MSKKTKPEAEEQEQVKTEAPAEETAKADAKPATDWEAKYNDLNDRYLRMAAEYDNFRKRSQREREQAYTDAVSRAATSFEEARSRTGSDRTRSRLVTCPMKSSTIQSPSA